MALFQFILVGLAAGWMMGMVRRGRGYGIVGNLVVGAVGSLIGWFFLGFLNVQAPTLFAQLATAVAGAVVFFLLLSVIKFKRKKKSTEEGE